MWYVYIIKSEQQNWRYTGSTKDLKQRFKSHNLGENQATKHYAPFELEAYVAVNSENKTRTLEKYFKYGSGNAVLKKTNLTVN